MTEWKRLMNLSPALGTAAVLITLATLAVPAAAADRMVVAEYFTWTG